MLPSVLRLAELGVYPRLVLCPEIQQERCHEAGVHQVHGKHRALPVSDVYSLAACRCEEHRLFRPQVPEDHNDSFTDYTKYRDADDETRNNIYNFIDSAEKTAIAVDCENSNPYKLYSVLKGLNPEELAKIEKITLYDDPHTTAGWDWLSKFTQIPTEHIEIDRVTDRKSLVDVRMTASVVTDFYRDGITSFIIVSSDSDFWGLIESLPKAKFLVMYEYEKCGTAIKNALTQHGIYYCAIDDFCTAGTEDMKRAVLFAELEKHLPSLVGENPLDLTHKIYEATRVTATMKEMENFCNRYVKTLKLKIVEGKFEIESNRQPDQRAKNEPRSTSAQIPYSVYHNELQ